MLGHEHQKLGDIAKIGCDRVVRRAFQSFFEMAVQRMITQDQLPVAICDITGESWQEIDFLEDYETAKSLFFSSETNA